MLLMHSIRHSITSFMRNNNKKSDHNKACKSMNDIASYASKASKTMKTKFDETAFVEDFFQAYCDPSVLDIRCTIKHRLNTLSHVSVAVVPSASLGSFQPPRRRTKELSLIPCAPLLPVFEDACRISVEEPPSPNTPSLVFSSPTSFSPRTLDAYPPISKEPRVVTIDDFQMLRFLSKGGLSQVHLVKDTVTDRRLALKVMKRSDNVFAIPTVKKLVIQETNIMALLNGCDWFVQLAVSWCDSDNLYLAMTYYPTDLESEIIRCEKLSEPRARFYMAELIIALEELHKHGIIHRDIKVSNILISADGHIVLADFGLSKVFDRKPILPERCHQPYWPFKADDDASTTPCRSPTELTFIACETLGSELEMAPEVILGDYYSFGVDFWAAGVSLYVMVTGTHPWSEEDEKSHQLQILEDEIEFDPEDEVSEECQDFIRHMLKKERTERLQIGQAMTSHPFFAGIDWKAMRNRTAPVPWIPDFISGHHFYEGWESLEFFVAGEQVDKDEDEFRDFCYTSPEMERCVETPPENFFRFGSEDEDEELCNSDLLEDDDVEEGVPWFDAVDCYFPRVSDSDSRISMSASFHSSSSLSGLEDLARGDEQEVIPVQVLVQCPPDAALLPGPVKVTMEPLSFTFRPVNEPIIAHVQMVISSRCATSDSGLTDEPHRRGFFDMVASWFKVAFPADCLGVGQLEDGNSNS